MFGYIRINKLELKFKEYYKYRGYYCGLCHTLKKNYSEISRLSLNYDITYLIVLLSSLYEPNEHIYHKRCIVHPFKKQLVIKNKIIEYAATVNVLLTYYKFTDNWQDDKSIKDLVSKAIFYKDFKRAKNKLPILNEKININLNYLSQLEEEKCNNIDKISNVFGNIMGEIFAYRDDCWSKYLKKIGFHFGKIIYILDAVDDLQQDIKYDRYNPLRYMNINMKELYNSLIFCLSIIDELIDSLPIIQNKGILDNILYSGILNQIKANLKIEEEQDERSL